MKITLNIILLLMTISLFFSCDDTIQEPDIINPEEVVITDNLSISTDLITDQEIRIKWNPVINADKYEIILNDTILIIDNVIKHEYLNYYYYRIINLAPDTEYKITVRAISPSLNVKNESIVVKTLESFVDSVKYIILDKYTYRDVSYNLCIRTHDGGYLLVGKGAKFAEEVFLFFKLNKDFEIEWQNELKQTDVEQWLQYIHEFPDGSFLLVEHIHAIKIDSRGNFVWRKKINTSKNDELSLTSGITLPGGGFVIIGSIFHYGNIRQYYTAKFSENGDREWEVFGDKMYAEDNQYILNRIALSNDKKRILIAGSLYYYSNYSGKASLLLLEYDLSSTLLDKKQYDIALMPSFLLYDINNIFWLSDDSSYILGTAQDWSSGRLNMTTIIAKTDENNEFLWYKNNYFSAGGYFPNIISSSMKSDGTFLCLIIDDRGTSFANLGLNGEVLWSIGYYIGIRNPTEIFIDEARDNKILLVTNDGRFITINPDGYISE